MISKRNVQRAISRAGADPTVHGRQQ